MVESHTAVCSGGGKDVEVAIELGHIIFRGRSLTSDGMGGQRRGDYMGRHYKVGGSTRVTTMLGNPEFPLH